LGHITTFGGHPVSAAASLACINVILEENLLEEVPSKHNIIRSTFENHDKVKEVRGKGLICSIQLESTEFNFAVIKRCIEKGVLTDWFLFCDDSLRIAPPLTISHGELQKGCDTIIEAINEC
jgi:acetylornithine/succinyldiaminopimelate/putrescine aminotransferase